MPASAGRPSMSAKIGPGPIGGRGEDGFAAHLYTPFRLTITTPVRRLDSMPDDKSLAIAPPIDRQIHLIRGRKVMLDADLAALYGVPTKQFNRAVGRNRDRFPEDDFMFQLTAEEAENLRFQIGTSSWGGRRYLPYVFTQEGVAMLASVLRSKRAIQMNIAIVLAFVRLREMIGAHKELAERFGKLEASHAEHASVLNWLVEQIKSMKALPAPAKKRIGFHANQD
jgi:hypothetical protein